MKIGLGGATILALSVLAACGPKPAAATTNTANAPLATGPVTPAPGAPAAASNATDAAAQTQLSFVAYDDPTENSFQVVVPKGWNTQGGVHRTSPVIAQPWVNSTSPDGSMTIFVGDANMPGFRVPQGGQSEGQLVQSMSPALPSSLALNWRNGADFAAYYGPTRLAQMGCTGATPTGGQPEPDVAAFQTQRLANLVQGIVIQGTFTPPQQDASLVTFSCQMNGKTVSAGIIADTATPIAQTWSAVVAGYIAPVGQEAWAQAILMKTVLSRQWNPQWDQAMRDATQDAINQQRQQDAAVEAQLQRESEANTQMILAYGQQQQNARTAEHNAFMAQMNAQSQQENANFAAYEQQKSLNVWRFNAVVQRNGDLYQDPNTGRIFEVDGPH